MSLRLRKVPALPLDVLRLGSWAIFVLALSIAPVHLTHVPAKYMGEAAGLVLDLSLDTEPEELHGDGAAAPWFDPDYFPSPALIWPPSTQETAVRGPCGCAPLPARGPPGQV